MPELPLIIDWAEVVLQSRGLWDKLDDDTHRETVATGRSMIEALGVEFTGDCAHALLAGLAAGPYMNGDQLTGIALCLVAVAEGW